MSTKNPWKNARLGPEESILKAIRIIDTAMTQCALVVNEGRLIGMVTDGDIRRAILAGISLEEPIKRIMNPNFISLGQGAGEERILSLMLEKKVQRLPILDAAGRVKNLVYLESLVERSRRDNWVVIMAGGMGTRLRPLTDTRPKPLVKVGDKPIMETILDTLISKGFHKFFVSVNYMSHMIKDYFGDGSGRGVEIRYLEETQRLGSAGALSLLPETPRKPLVILNADLLTKVNFGSILDFHVEQESQATMCVKEYEYQVPYGVVKIKDNHLVNVDEKPVQKFFVNAGIYVLEPEVLSYIPRNTPFDMTTLIEKCREEKSDVGVFPIREYWLDIGRTQDLEKARSEYNAVFG
jgi:dTDP-glucose pyrophosphorylase